jgi:adenylate cyclase
VRVEPPSTVRLLLWLAALALPLCGLYVLLAHPQLDSRWEQHPAHFWLVLAVAAGNFAIGALMSEAARRWTDARVFLIALLTSAGFLGLHALATPGVLVPRSNSGFVIATPVGLLGAAVFAVLSSLDWPPGPTATLMRWQAMFRAGLIGILVAWALVSLAQLPPLDKPLPEQAASTPLHTLAAIGVVSYVVSAAVYFRLYRRRPALLLLAVATAFVLLGEAMIAIAFAHSWHATWWEWHLLMLLAFGLIAYSVRVEWQHEGMGRELFSDIYQDQTRGHLEELTVCFADLQGFTAYSERTGDVEVKEMLDTYFRVAGALARAHGGIVDKTIGDALMFVFRTPGHELRAARMALAFQQQMAEVGKEHPDWLRFRVGINSGEAMVGLVPVPGAKGFTVTGDTVNVASRLEGQARAGEVVISGATRAALGVVAEIEELGELAVKGREMPVNAFVLRGLNDLGPTGPRRSQ